MKKILAVLLFFVTAFVNCSAQKLKFSDVHVGTKIPVKAVIKVDKEHIDGVLCNKPFGMSWGFNRDSVTSLKSEMCLVVETNKIFAPYIMVEFSRPYTYVLGIDCASKIITGTTSLADICSSYDIVTTYIICNYISETPDDNEKAVLNCLYFEW